MLDKTTRLAYDRTWLAYERTMQAWIRTAASLITFGFSVYKLIDIVAPPSSRQRLLGPREFGTALVCIGLAALVFAAIDSRRSIRLLRQEYGQSPRSMSVFFGALVALLGIFALVVMFAVP